MVNTGALTVFNLIYSTSLIYHMLTFFLKNRAFKVFSILSFRFTLNGFSFFILQYYSTKNCPHNKKIKKKFLESLSHIFTAMFQLNRASTTSLAGGMLSRWMPFLHICTAILIHSSFWLVDYMSDKSPSFLVTNFDWAAKYRKYVSGLFLYWRLTDSDVPQSNLNTSEKRKISVTFPKISSFTVFSHRSTQSSTGIMTTGIHIIPKHLFFVWTVQLQLKELLQ